MTGADLAKIRKAAHLTQKELAALVGIGRQAVSYWELKSRLNLRAYAMRKIGEVLPLPEEPAALRARTGWAFSLIAARFTPPIPRPRRQRCGAKTRKGTPCAAKPLPGKHRCKFHGGMSTGPKSDEGRARISQRQKLRWSAWRGMRARVPIIAN